ncbi:MAG: DUF6051 family protein [Bacteroidales bacterium]|nr:DUF6051 family protein [Bacteroidales bacterium]MDD4602945.1 DUF6051 family protein [Bacteroidales bacterium]
MSYSVIYNDLKRKTNYNDPSIFLDEKTIIRNFLFISENATILPGESSYYCPIHSFQPADKGAFQNRIVTHPVLDIHDSEVCENKQFRYHIIAPADISIIHDFVLMFHGFNEKTWDKYLPWAREIVENTGKAVVLFPFAFHMNRSPITWSDSRQMNKVSEERKKAFPNLIAGTFSNVAISTRLHVKPQRFIWSGLQSYYDVIQLLDQIKTGQHPFIDKNARYDLFAYSIGALLAQILIMTNHKDYFSTSKLCLFCGGTVFNRLSPVSRYILDSEANVALYSYIVEHLETHLKNDLRLKHYLSGDHPEGINFCAMLNYNVNRQQREEILRKLSDQVYAIALENDKVVPPYEVINTLQGSNRNIPIPVDIIDFDYPYKHENPFPSNMRFEPQITEGFEKVFNRVCRFLSRS